MLYYTHKQIENGGKKMNEYVEKLEAMVKTMENYASGDYFLHNFP